MDVLFKLFVVIVFIIFSEVSAETINYCHDEQAQSDWHKKMRQFGYEPEWQAMDKLRTQLCRRVDQGRLSIDEASAEFERQRQAYIIRLRERLENKHGKEKASA